MTQIIVACIVAAFGFAGTVIGSYFGVRASNKLVVYRIEQLEKKVDKHNGVMERTFKLEERCALAENDIKVVNHRIKDLEERDR
jgi:MFS superfamily sulfate permease-like transporter